MTNGSNTPQDTPNAMMMMDGSDGADITVHATEILTPQDYEAFAAKHLPDFGYAIKDFKTFTWNIRNWKKEEEMKSPTFECANRKWHLKHRYAGDETDWGFKRFFSLQALGSPTEGQKRPVIENNSMDITVYMRVLDDPTGVLWHTFNGFDFRKETGFVGLKNQGVTSYLNTVIQVMFHNHALRKAVYQIPTENDNPSKSIALALQRLFYHLETSTEAGTQSEGAIDAIFSAEMKSYFHTQGMRNLAESFEHYTTKEKIADYGVENSGLHDAEKGLEFHSFAPYLVLQLMRPGSISTSFYLLPRQKVPLGYRLHAVMAHFGSVNKGRYVAFITPDKGPPAQKRQVFEDNYGGTLRSASSQNEISRAAVLVYVRESADEVLRLLLDESIPPPLKKIIDDQSFFEDQKRKNKEKKEKNTHLDIKVVTKRTFERHEGFDLANFSKVQWPVSELSTFRVPKEEDYATFKRRIADYFNYNEKEIRFWVIVNRVNKTIRLYNRIQDDTTAGAESIRKENATPSGELRLYLEILNKPSKPDPPQSMLIFLKHFDQSKQTLLGVGSIYINRKHKVSTLIPVINQLMRWKPETLLNLYEEVRPDLIEKLKPNFTYAQGELDTGDIICFERALSQTETGDLKSKGLHTEASSFYYALLQRVVCTFVDSSNKSFKFDLTLSKKDSYEVMSNKVGKHLRHDPMKFLFTVAHGVAGRPHVTLKRKTNQTLVEMLAVKEYSKPIVYYEKLDISILELELNRSLDVIWMASNNRRTSMHTFVLKKILAVKELKTRLSAVVGRPHVEPEKIRIFQISEDGRAQKEFESPNMIYSIPESGHIYAETMPISSGHLSPLHGDRLLDVFHFSQEFNRIHGVPFKFVVKRGEKFSDTKKRLQARIGLSDSAISKYRFALSIADFKQPLYLTDGTFSIDS
ncbi:ICP0-binding domain of ubiquitin-specific protease 7-domain-containing protein [Gymnopilus junonius]|uniref:ubiquitinyl hydrolase 1 n=1 Tax=Gymnopilus junonius TaxID=109634 RepID=A0A9P5NSX9_GYMJU|nr:ICP0-binding domain of ubiquitin-specific protease 7-domain-containing protein [Gymnopilus junonius]